MWNIVNTVKTRQVYNGHPAVKLMLAVRTRQVYNGPQVVKINSAKSKEKLVKNDIWTKEDWKNA